MIDWKEVEKEAKAMRDKKFYVSSQLTLGELILKLEAVDKDLFVYFDDENYIPVGVDSWRGAYDELAIEYEKTSGLIKIPKVKNLLLALNSVLNTELQGYKGGDYFIEEDTPVWVANWGEDTGYRTNEKYYLQAVVDVEVKDNKAVLKTELIDY